MPESVVRSRVDEDIFECCQTAFELMMNELPT